MKNKNKMLEEICTFAEDCVTGSYGAYPICSENYIDCEHYQRIIAKRLEKYNKDRIEVLK